MHPVFYVMAIMGCGDGDASCTAARVDQARYTTLAQCRADLPAGLARNSDLSFPVITASCRTNGGLTIAKTAKAAPQG